MKNIRTLFYLSTLIFLLSTINSSIIDGSPDQIAIRIAGLTSRLEKMDLENLKTTALKLEAYSNAKKGGLILGGLHDYINTINEEDFEKFIIKLSMNNPELLDEAKFNSVLENNIKNSNINISNDSSNSNNRSIYHDIHEKHENSGKFLDELEALKPLKLGGLHDYIFKKDRKTLIKWAITAEAHYFVALKANQEEPCGQWIYRKISQMSNENLIKFILNMVKKFPELDSATALNTLARIYGINDEIVNYVSNEANFDIFEKEENSNKTNQATDEGYMHNNHSHEEFNKNQKHSHHSTHSHHEDSEHHVTGLHDFINSGDRETLIKWALTAEAHTHRTLEKKPIGGLHDYITSLSSEEIGKYITIAAKRMPDLNSKEKMDQLAVQYGITDDAVKELAKQHLVMKDAEHIYYGENTGNDQWHADLHSESIQECLVNGDRKTLVKWALVAEAVLNAHEPNGKILGGLHDYIESLSNEQLAKYISVASRSHPELNNKENMEKLAETYEISHEHHSDENKNEELKKNENENKSFNTRLDSLFGELMEEDRKNLIGWAFAAEKYDREKHGFHQLEGGLEDYAWKLDKDKLVDYITDKARTYPELRDKNYLEFLSRNYKFNRE